MSNFKLSSRFDRLRLGVIKSKVSEFFAVPPGRMPFASVSAKTYAAKPAGVVAGFSPVPVVDRPADITKVANPIVINFPVDVVYDVGPFTKLNNPRYPVSKVNSVVDFGVKISTSVFCGKGLFAGKPPIPLVRPCFLSMFVAIKRSYRAFLPKKSSGIRIVFKYGFQKILRNFGRWHLDLSMTWFALANYINCARGCKHA